MEYTETIADLNTLFAAPHRRLNALTGDWVLIRRIAPATVAGQVKKHHLTNGRLT
jgi:hypothetical protein